MKFRTPLAVLLLAAFAITALAADAPTTKKKGNRKSAPVVEKPWFPDPYGDEEGKLPPAYTGMNAEKFLDHFKWKVEGLRKEEYETNEEFARRSADKNAVIAPITTTALYAFKVDGIRATYDADTQTYAFVNSGIACSETSRFGKHPGYVSCRVAIVSRMTDKYIGGNAFGVSRTVTEVRERNFGLAMPSGHSAISAILSPISYVRGGYEYRDKVSVPLEKARSLKDSTLAVLFVGHVADIFLVEGRSTRSEATIHSPLDSQSWEEAAPFDLKKIVYYVFETGEILGARAF